MAAGPVEKPPGDDINRDLSKKVPEPKIGIDAVRKGFTALRRSNVRLLSHDGRDMSEAIGDAISYPTTSEFLKLIANVSIQDAEMMAHVVADAALVDELPKDTYIYLETLYANAKVET
jgi:hypothetical protein